ncbi:PAS domain S-box protein [Methylobacterium durans]|uniref:ATP-binding protein n=1 Tax=Methylobacterium durans TaxID=2202825 RepID=UPI002AFF0282|nr:ATP-binding protein [Methylobacterium durans]MEA1834795.1 PAS domain S-box protein [Methylobacterium durans]
MSPPGRDPAAAHDFQADILAIESIAAVPTILDVVCRTTGMGFAAVARVTEDRWVACQVRDDIAFGLQPGGELKVATTICHEIRQSGTAVVINHVAEDEAYGGHPTPAMYGFQSYISMPIVLPDGTFFGTLCAIDPKPAQLDRPEVVGMFKMFADLIAFHLDAHVRLASREAAERSAVTLKALNSTLADQVEARTNERDRIWQVSHDMLGVADSNGVWLSINPAWTMILGWEAEEIVGRTSEWLEHPEDHEKTRAEVARLAAGHSTLAFENHFRTRDGSYRTLSWRAVPAENLLYCVARDVTEQRERMLQLEQAEEALRQSQKLEAVGQLTGGVAHDFNNLLTIIRSSVDFLRRPNLSEERRARYFNAVSDTVDRAAKLTGQLLAFARRQTLLPEVFEVGAQLRAVADMLDTVTGARIRVVTEMPDTPCFVKADLSQFETALVNMAVNARDAMDGEGLLTLRLDCSGALPPIRGHAGAPGPFAAVSLTDSGSGIAPEQIGRIFEPFFTTKEVGKGTGLGLSQVFGFAKQSGGDVAVESAVGQGTTFTLYLPEIEARPHQEPAATHEGEIFPIGDGQSVLVVEDNVEVGRFATQILEDLGYSTTWAANAEQALAELGPDGFGFDVVFSDVVMPGMGGIELAKILRRNMPHLPVLLASGYSHVLAQEGAHGFELLHKPYSADQLGRILSRIIAQRSLRGSGQS